MSIASLADRIRPRTRLRAARSHWSARRHALPDFLILGTQKGGTSSLFDYLTALPGVITSATKELHFFTKHSVSNFYDNHGLDWYRSQFPLRSELRQAGAITGEATPRYMYEPLAMTRIARDLPDSRWIVILREPIERAQSHYEMMTGFGKEQRSFTDALHDDLKVFIASTSTASASAPTRYDNLDYLERGIYTQQLSVIAGLRPGIPTLVLFSEHLFAGDPTSFSLLHSFLGLPEPEANRFPHSRRGQGTTTIDPIARERLATFFTENNAGLAELLQSDRFVTVDPTTWPDWGTPEKSS